MPKDVEVVEKDLLVKGRVVCKRIEAESSSTTESEWERQIKDKVVYDSTNSRVEIGTKLEVDGDTTINSKLELGTSGTIGSTLAGKFSSKQYIHRVQYSYSSVGVYISFMSKEKEEIESMSDLAEIIEEEGLLLKENLYGVNCIALNNTDYYQVLTMETGGAMIQLQLVSMQNGVAPILLNAGGTFSDYVVAL